jgi:Tfp pilus assembly protein PilF
MTVVVARRLVAAALMVTALALGGCGTLQAYAPSAPAAPDASAPPQEVVAYHLVEDGRRQLDAGQAAAAVATFQKALALAPSSPHANLALAEAKIRQGEFRAALVYANRVLRLTSERSEWRWRVALVRGQAFEGTGDAASAQAEFRRVLELDPGNEDAKSGLSRLETGTGLPN